jgi:hypothetical protein
LVILGLLAFLIGSLQAPSPARQVVAAQPPSAPQPEPPITAAFLYPWYPSHWSENGVYPYTNFTPWLGFYLSTDDATIMEQLSAAAHAHLEALIVSWFQQGELTDVSFRHIMSVAENAGSPIKFSAYYEPEGYADPPVSQIVSDLQYLASNAFNSPAYLHVYGKPVLFVYGSGNEGCSLSDRWLEARRQSGIDVFIVLKVFPGYRDCVGQPESWHQYSPTAAYDAQLPYSVSVSPGFWKAGAQPILSRDPVTFETAVRWMSVTGAFFQLVTTWNEWAEGTAVEPAVEYGSTYVEILCRSLPGATPCATAKSSTSIEPSP